MPIESAFTRSIFSEVLPRQKLPPPITTQSWIPLSRIFFTCLATSYTVFSSKPCFFSPASASPLSFNNTLFISIIVTSYVFSKFFYPSIAQYNYISNRKLERFYSNYRSSGSVLHNKKNTTKSDWFHDVLSFLICFYILFINN